MSLFKPELKVTKTMLWTTLSEYILTTSSFDKIGDYPVYFYTVNNGNDVCPIIKKDNQIDAIFTTGAGEQGENFDSKFSLNALKELNNGTYLYDFKANRVIYDYIDRTTLEYNNHDWSTIPPVYSETKFSHVIALDGDGILHKIYNQDSTLATAIFIGYLVNLTFPPGNYKLKTYGGVDFMFNLLCLKYGLPSVSIRFIDQFEDTHFKPIGQELPTCTLSKNFTDQLVEEDDIVEMYGNHYSLDAWDEDKYNQYFGLLGTGAEIGSFNYDDVLCISSLIGVHDYPIVDKETDVYKDFNVPGIHRLILSTTGHLQVLYSSKKISIEQIEEHLVLPAAYTNYTDVDEKESTEDDDVTH